MACVECYDEGKAVGDLLLVIVYQNKIKIKRYLFNNGEFSKRMLIGHDDSSPGIIVDVSGFPEKLIGYFNFGNWEIVTSEHTVRMYLRDKYKGAIRFDPSPIIEDEKEMFLFSYLKYESIKEADKAFIERLKKNYEIPDGIIHRFFKWLFKRKISK
jgi:hypothetical protein